LKASFPSITFSNEQEIKQNHEQKPQWEADLESKSASQVARETPE
jgi:hypothetical protein